MIDETLEEARSAIFALRPATLDDLGLAPSLHTLVERFEAETDIRVQLSVPEQSFRLVPHLETALYRIAQETLTNVKKHSAASNVRVALTVDHDDVALEIADDGDGFDVETFARSRSQTSFGLAGMRERVELVGGSMTISSSIGHGTIVSVRMPVRVPAEMPA